MKKAKNVDAYIAGAPREVRSKLRELRKAIKTAAPKAAEKISYRMPYYGYKGRLAYFAYAKELTRYKTATATIHFPLNEKLPIPLIKKLIRVGVRNNEAKAKKTRG